MLSIFEDFLSFFTKKKRYNYSDYIESYKQPTYVKISQWVLDDFKIVRNLNSGKYEIEMIPGKKLFGFGCLKCRYSEFDEENVKNKYCSNCKYQHEVAYPLLSPDQFNNG